MAIPIYEAPAIHVPKDGRNQRVIAISSELDNHRRRHRVQRKLAVDVIMERAYASAIGER